MLVNYGVAVPESQFTTTPDKRGVIGQIAFTDTGRQFRYCKSADTDAQPYWTGMKNDATNKNGGLAADAKTGDTVIQLKPPPPHCCSFKKTPPPNPPRRVGSRR